MSHESGDRADFIGTVRRAVQQPHRAHTRPIDAAADRHPRRHLRQRAER